MIYPFLAAIYFVSLFLVFLFFVMMIWKPRLWRENRSRVGVFYTLWFGLYFLFIVFFTGPITLKAYPPRHQSKYKLPWSAGVSRFVIQGNRSFTSHRGLHRYAWDFFMPNGTEILSARDGRVARVVDAFDGVGLRSNYIHIKHSDGTYSGYAHIQKESSVVVVGEWVQQGQPIALSGMVGQTIIPHLHFYVLNENQAASLPISFNDVEGGVVFAGRFYTSKNKK